MTECVTLEKNGNHTTVPVFRAAGLESQGWRRVRVVERDGVRTIEPEKLPLDLAEPRASDPFVVEDEEGEE